jgi:hypothetical protein
MSGGRRGLELVNEVDDAVSSANQTIPERMRYLRGLVRGRDDKEDEERKHDESDGLALVHVHPSTVSAPKARGHASSVFVPHGPRSLREPRRSPFRLGS